MSAPRRPSTTVVLSLLLALLVLVGQWVAYELTSGVLEESVRAREVDKIDTVAGLIKGLITSVEGDAKLVARLVAADDTLGRNILRAAGPATESKSTVAAQIDKAFAFGGSQTLEVIDRNERVLYRAHEPARSGDIATGWGIAEALAGTSMSATMRTPEGLLIQAIEPVRAGSEVVGAVVSGVLLNPKLVQELSRQVGAHLALLDRKGMVLGTRSLAAEGADLLGVQDAFKGKVPVYRLDAEARNTTVYLPVNIVDEAFVVLARLDSEEAYGLIDSGKRRSALNAVLVLLVSLVGGLLALHWVMSPLRQLRRRAQSTAVELTGHAIEYSGRDEVSLVVKVLDTLTGRLLQRNRELSRATEHAEAASLAKSQFLSSMSHEIRTPLNGVLGLAELLRDTPLNAEQMRYVSAIDSAGRVLHGLLSDVLDLAKIEEGQVTLERIDFDPSQVVRDLVGVFSEMASVRGLTLRTDVSELSCLWASGDPTRLRQVLSNLLSNAVKFTQSGEVRLVVQSIAAPVADSRPWCRFSVKDTGIGVAPADLNKLFRRFEQADVSTTRQFGGSGLGLAICKHLVEMMGGSIQVTSVAGQGSHFWFDIPLEIALTPVSTATPVGNASVAAGLKVLVAEDNAINQLVVKTLLTRLGAQVTLVENGELAVQEVGRGTFDVVFMDCQMPVMDGFEATRQIRAMEQRNPRASGPLPIIALTANALVGDREACLAAGMTDYVAKPVTSQALIRALEQHCACFAPDADCGAGALAASAGNEVVYEPGVLGALSMVADGTAPMFAEEMLDLFEADARKLLLEMAQAIARGDLPTCMRLVHTLKSTAAQVGAVALSSEASRQEAVLRSGLEAPPDGHGRLTRALAAFQKARQTHIGRAEDSSGVKV